MNKTTLLFLCLFCLKGFSQPSAVSQKSTYLPSALINGRFYIKITAPTGDTVLAFCDTGGGFNALYPATISKLHLDTAIAEVNIKGEKIKYLPAQYVIANPDIPPPHIQDYYSPYIKTPFFNIADDPGMSIFLSYIPQDIFLGQFFFIDHSWTFDYLNGRIYINTPLASTTTDADMQTIGFKKSAEGKKKFGHPSMKVEIDGKIIDVLFDTGASILLSKNTQTMLPANSKSIGGSFIARSLFEQWHAQHPEWRYIEKGEATGADMIQVPQVKVGSLTAGPVWFAKRPDEAWSKGMITTMDKVVKGAIGGSFLQYFIVTIDYNSELIRFKQHL